MQISGTKYHLKDKRRTGVCNGNCPSCRGSKGSTKKVKGFKRKSVRQMQFEITYIQLLGYDYK